jgi:fido (protein-threonine AMPylation protein)
MDPRSEGNSSTTRHLETTRGTLSYLEVADIVAGYLSELLDKIAEGEYADEPLTVDLLRQFHAAILEPIVPAIAGKWRPVDVVVGSHLPPPYYQVPVMMSTYMSDLQAQIDACGSDLERQVEALAFCEGQMLHIHPFEDFNGRAVRAFLMEVLNRLDMPPLELSVPRDSGLFDDYKAALRKFDVGDRRPLQAFWGNRLSEQLGGSF